MLTDVNVVDRQSEYEVTLARIRRRAAMLERSSLPSAWRRVLEALDAEALAAKTIRRRALAEEP